MRGRARLVVAAVLLVLVAPTLDAGAAQPARDYRETMPGGDELSGPRDYLVHVPGKLAPRPQRALVVLLHGCAQTATELRDGVPWNALADERGFVVVYPEQNRAHTGGNTSGCWNSGQAPAFERGIGELHTVAQITTHVRDQYSVPAGRVFIAGLSSGAQMTAAMAATYPDLYAAMGSYLGCGYPCSDPTGVAAWNRMGTLARRVPGFFVAGTADYLVSMPMSQGGMTGWVAANDYADDGARNDSVSSQPVVEHRDAVAGERPGPALCVQNWNNPCPADVTGWAEYPTTISRYLDAGDQSVVVESWVLHGLSHNYPGGHETDGTFTDPHGPDVTTPMWEFFLANAR